MSHHPMAAYCLRGRRSSEAAAAAICIVGSHQRGGKSQKVERRSNTRNGCDALHILAEQRMYFWELKVTPNRPLHLWKEVSFYQLALRAELINMWCFVTRPVGIMK